MPRLEQEDSPSLCGLLCPLTLAEAVLLRAALQRQTELCLAAI